MAFKFTGMANIEQRDKDRPLCGSGQVTILPTHRVYEADKICVIGNEVWFHYAPKTNPKAPGDWYLTSLNCVLIRWDNEKGETNEEDH